MPAEHHRIEMDGLLRIGGLDFEVGNGIHSSLLGCHLNARQLVEKMLRRSTPRTELFPTLCRLTLLSLGPFGGDQLVQHPPRPNRWRIARQQNRLEAPELGVTHRLLYRFEHRQVLLLE